MSALDEKFQYITFNILSLIVEVFRQIYYYYLITLQLFERIRRGSNTWIVMLGRLIIFATILTPAWIKLLKGYFFDPNVIRNIRYSNLTTSGRNYLDIYLPTSIFKLQSQHKEEKSSKINVIIMVGGGAWIIGYKLWSGIIAMVFAKFGYIAVTPDYRNFPEARVDEMLQDMRDMIIWTIDHISDYGGNPNKIILSGVSAGAQLSLCTLLDDYKRKKASYTHHHHHHHHHHHDSHVIPLTPNHVKVSTNSPIKSTSPNHTTMINNNNNNTMTTEIQCKTLLPLKTHPMHVYISDHICMYIGISSPFNLVTLSSHLNQRGLSASILYDIFHRQLEVYSPTCIVNKLIQEYHEIQTDNIHIHTHTHEDDNESHNISYHTMTPYHDDGQYTWREISPSSSPNTSTRRTSIKNTSLNTLQISNIDKEKIDRHRDKLNDVYDSHDKATIPYLNLHTDTHISSPPQPTQSYSLIEPLISPTYPISSTTTTTTATANTTTASAATTAAVGPLHDFPPVLLYHGMNDKTIPYPICTEFGNTLCEAGAWVRVCLIPSWSHTDSTLEAPMRGDYSLVMDIIYYIQELYEKNRLDQSSNSAIHVSAENPSNSRINCTTGSECLWHVESPKLTMDITTSQIKSENDARSSTGQHTQQHITNPIHTESVYPSQQKKEAYLSLGIQCKDSARPLHYPEYSMTYDWLIDIAKVFNPF